MPDCLPVCPQSPEQGLAHEGHSENEPGVMTVDECMQEKRGTEEIVKYKVKLNHSNSEEALAPDGCRALSLLRDGGETNWPCPHTNPCPLPCQG